jgi:hypothetical protein
MITLNRTAIMGMPGQPFLDWLHRADPTSGGLSLEDFRREPTVYLLPESESQGEARECLKDMCGQIFEEQLDGWYRVPSSWPSRRDMDAFDSWFEWSFHSVVVDLCDEPLQREELRPARVPSLAGKRCAIQLVGAKPSPAYR